MSMFGARRRTPGRRTTRCLLAIVLVATGLTVSQAVVAAPPAAAADSCTALPVRGPFWWANVHTTNMAGGRMALAIDEPWSIGSFAFMWTWANSNKQKYWEHCLSVDPRDGIAWLQLRYAHKTGLCLEHREDDAVLLNTCNPRVLGQRWKRVRFGTRPVASEGGGERLTYFWATERAYWVGTPKCLTAYDHLWSNGTPVYMAPCDLADNQLWY